MRFFVSPKNWNPPHFLLEGEEAHHASRVMRVQQGTQVRVFQGEGEEWLAKVSKVEAKQVELTGINPIQSPQLPARLLLFQALPKAAKMEWIIQKAVELGVTEVIPIRAERSLVKLDALQAEKKQQKWQRTAMEAAKQSGHPLIPQIHLPHSLQQALSSFPVDLCLLTSLQQDTQPILTTLQQYQETHCSLPESIAVLIGPEGDFSFAEIEHCLQAKAKSVTLGPLVLRTETAAIASLSQLSAGLIAL